MSEAIMTTIISSVFLLIGTIVTVAVSSSKNRAIAVLEQQGIKEQIRILTDRVDEHNGYAVEIPLIKKDIAYIKEFLNGRDYKCTQTG